MILFCKLLIYKFNFFCLLVIFGTFAWLKRFLAVGGQGVLQHKRHLCSLSVGAVERRHTQSLYWRGQLCSAVAWSGWRICLHGLQRPAPPSGDLGHDVLGDRADELG